MAKMETRGDFPAVEGSVLALLHPFLFLTWPWRLDFGFASGRLEQLQAWQGPVWGWRGRIPYPNQDVL